MKILGKVEIEKIVQIDCDLCGKTFYDAQEYQAPNFPSIEDNIISIDHTGGYTSNFDDQRFIVDICVDCLNKKIIPLVKKSEIRKTTN